MYCMKCGKELAPTARFCKYCGAMTLYGMQMKEPASQETELPPPAETGKKEVPPKAAPKRYLPVTAAFIVLILGVSGVFAIWKMKKSGGEPAASVSEEPPIMDAAENQEPPEEPEQSQAQAEEAGTEPVKEVEYRKIGRINRNQYGEEVSRLNYLYDETGTIYQAVVIGRDGEPTDQYYTFEYDENGTLVKEIQHIEDERYKVEIFYNAAEGEPDEIQYSYYEDGQTESIVEYEYGIGAVKETYYQEDGQGFQIFEYKRNAEGSVTEEKESAYDSQETLIGTYTYQRFYDDNGNLSGWESDDGMYPYTVNYTHNGEVCGTISYNSDGTVDVQASEGYELAGDRFIKAGELRNQVRDHWEDIYDDMGNLTATLWFNKSGDLLGSYEYLYEEVETGD